MGLGFDSNVLCVHCCEVKQIMKAVVQRVSKADVKVENKNIGSIHQGLMVLLGVAQGDTTADADYLGDKIINLRIFEDRPG